MKAVIGVALAGSLGALARYGLDAFITRRASSAFPWGIFAINISGAFLLGLVFTVMTERWAGDTWLRTTLTVGFIGSYTTFSTLSYQTYRLASDRMLGLAAANMVGTCAAGLVAVYVGILLARAV